MKDIAVGIDIGTTSVKSIALSVKGEIIYEKSISHDLISLRPGYAEEDPELWWNSSERLLRDMVGKIDKKRIASLSFSGMVPTLILLDENGKALRYSIQQNDARAHKEINEWKQLINEDDYHKQTGNTINQQVLFPKIDWLRKHEPEVLRKTHVIMGSYNYAVYRATGVTKVDKNWALESGYWLIREEKWYEQIIYKSGITLNQLPEVSDSRDIVGYTSKNLEKDTSFPSGIPVLAGIADHVASALASGVRENGDLLLKLGGAGDILLSTDELHLDKRMFIDYHVIPDTFLINGCMASSGLVVKWLMKQLRETDASLLDKEAEAVPPGSEQLIMLPYFLGEKTPIFDTNARGVYFGLNLMHTRAHLFRAVLEAVAFGFYHHVKVFNELNLDIKRVFLSNGGAKSFLWKKIVLDVIGFDGFYLPNHPGSCLGAALLAMESTGLSKNWNTLNEIQKKNEVIEYSKDNHGVYQKYFEVYLELYDRLQTLFPKLLNI